MGENTANSRERKKHETIKHVYPKPEDFPKIDTHTTEYNI